MRRNTPTLETTQRSVRASICTHCPGRPAGSESWESDKPRKCERTCRLFFRLPALREVARLCDPMLADPHDVIMRQIRIIRERAAPGNHGARPVDGLTLQTRKIARVLERLFSY